MIALKCDCTNIVQLQFSMFPFSFLLLHNIIEYKKKEKRGRKEKKQKKKKKRVIYMVVVGIETIVERKIVG